MLMSCFHITKQCTNNLLQKIKQNEKQHQFLNHTMRQFLLLLAALVAVNHVCGLDIDRHLKEVLEDAELALEEVKTCKLIYGLSFRSIKQIQM